MNAQQKPAGPMVLGVVPERNQLGVLKWPSFLDINREGSLAVARGFLPLRLDGVDQSLDVAFANISPDNREALSNPYVYELPVRRASSAMDALKQLNAQLTKEGYSRILFKLPDQEDKGIYHPTPGLYEISFKKRGLLCSSKYYHLEINRFSEDKRDEMLGLIAQFTKNRATVQCTPNSNP